MLMRSLPGICRPAARRLTACNAAAMLVPARSVSSNGTGTYQKTQFREAVRPPVSKSHHARATFPPTRSTGR